MNWVETIALLKAAGYTQPELASECKCSQSVISDLSTGKRKVCRYEIGETLLRLHAKAKRKLAANTKAA